MKSIEISDILSYRFLSSLRFAPGGKRAAFAVSEADEEENTYRSRLWLYENGAVRQLTALGEERGFSWLNDHELIFPACRSEKEKKRRKAGEEFTVLYRLDLRGGEALPWLELPFAARGIRVLDENHLAVTGGVDKCHPELYAASEEDRKAVWKEREDDKDYEVFDELPFWFNGAGVTNGHRSGLFLVTAEPFAVRRITAPGEDTESLAMLGDELFFAVSERRPKMALRGFTVRALRWSTGEIRDVYASSELVLAGLEAGEDRLWLLASRGERYGLNENAWIYSLDPRSGSLTLVRREEGSLYNSVGSDCRLGGGRGMVARDGKLYHLRTREGDSILCAMTPDGEDVPLVTKAGSMDCFDLGEEALAIGLYDMGLQELYRADLATGELTRITHFNDEALRDRYVAAPEPLTVESQGLSISGWVLKPRDFDPAKTYPAVLDIHGGPKTVYGPVFYHEMQCWAGKGYFVFFCNPKGSDGRDNEFADIRGAYGKTDYQNLMDFTDAVLRAWPQIDKSRLCETGGSYGGFMTNWIIGHTDRFCCAASQRSISNWLSFYGVSDIGFYFAADQEAADIYDSPEKLWERSPLSSAKNVKTPTLFIHSDEDYRCPLEQGIQMYAALVDREVPARLCLFYGENHELSRSGKPLHRLRRLKEITDWFARWSHTEEKE